MIGALRFGRRKIWSDRNRVRSQPPDETLLPAVPNSGDDMRAGQMRQLAGERPYSAARAVDQHALAAQLSASEQRVSCGQSSDRKRGRIGKAHRIWYRRK